jgi:diguanylate cyclase (GGDEF)-like protein
VLDVDNLKAIKDRSGQAAGDALLCQCSDLLMASCQPGDVTARVDVDEFTILSIETDVVGARALVARLRRQLRIAHVAAAVGVATRRLGEDLGETWKRADEVMRADRRRRSHTS